MSPKLLNDEGTLVPVVKKFGFSNIRVGKLEESEYTLVTIIIDVTGSVSDFARLLEDLLEEVVKACKKHPRSEKMLIRILFFNEAVMEIHDFAPLSAIDPSMYKGKIAPAGYTALFDATDNGIEKTLMMSKSLIAQDYDVNGAVYIITDGADNNSRYASCKSIKEKISNSKKSEVIESLFTALIGVNAIQCKKYLESFKNDAELTQYIDAGDATANNIAKIAGWISKSVSSVSSVVGSGGPSQPLNF